MAETNYLSELRSNWRPLLAATIGLGTGFSLSGHITSAVAPHLIRDNGWAMADFAMVSGLSMIVALALPLAGRLTDVIGVRSTAAIGLVSLPLVYLAYSMMSGELSGYVAIFMVQATVCVTTTATVYTRLAVQYIKRARGLALAIVASGPAVVGAIGGPLLNSYVEAYGWRSSYQALAAFAAIAGVVTFLLIPPRAEATAAGAPQPRRRASRDYPLIFRTAAFWILIVSMLLCNLPQVLILSQLKLLLLDNGVSGPGASIMFSALSIGMLTGRFITGAALDRFQPYIVSFVTLALPSMGLFLFASSLDSGSVLTLAVFCIGFAFGAEGDIVGFLVARRFGIGIYSSVLGLVTAAMSTSAALGAALLSLFLARTGSFDGFLIVVGIAVLIGSALLLLLGKGEEQQISSNAIHAVEGNLPTVSPATTQG